MKNFISVVDDNIEARIENAWKKYSKYIWVVLIAIVGSIYSINEYSQGKISDSSNSAQMTYKIIKSEDQISIYKTSSTNLNDLDKIIAIKSIAEKVKSEDKGWLIAEIEKNIESNNDFKFDYIDLKVSMMVEAKKYEEAIKAIKSKIYLSSLDWMAIGDLSKEMGNKKDSNGYYLQGIKVSKTEGVKKLILGKLGNIEALRVESK
jgi:hypothetical protein